MVLLALAGVSALASEATDGVLLPGARPLENTASIGVSGGAAGMIFAGSFAAVGLEGSLRLSDRVGLAGFGGLVGTTLAARGLEDTRRGRLAVSLLSLRVMAVDREDLHLAPLLTVAAAWQQPVVGTVGLGLAMEAGGDRLRLDVSVPSLIGVGAVLIDGREYGLDLRWASTGAEVGITARAGEHHEFRVGAPSILTWRWREEHAYFELSGTFLLVAGSIAAEVGARF